MHAVIFIEANGKTNVWHRLAHKIGLTAQVVPTTGHVCSFPVELHPMLIDVESDERLEHGRRLDPIKVARIREAVNRAPKDAALVIATDDDMEGDVIAYDLVEVLLKLVPERSSNIVRIRPGPMTARGIRAALSSAKSIRAMGYLAQMRNDAIPGRARAVTDRWIGSVFSKMADRSIGRVRTALLGALYILGTSPGALQGRPEIGEVMLQARGAGGGRPYFARIPLYGDEAPDRISALRRLAVKFQGRFVPGQVRQFATLHAAVAPRIGYVRPFNTADILVHAARFHGIPVGMAMEGLQEAYREGKISYPRTASRDLSIETASKVTIIGHGCGIDNLDVRILAYEGKAHENAEPEAHEALYPVMDASAASVQELKDLVRAPIKTPPQGWDTDSVRNAMVTLVARRSFEAAREIRLERGGWMPDNSGQLSPGELEIMRDLEWFRDEGFSFPWSRSTTTAVRAWPLDSILLEMMVIEDLGKPSTYAQHVETAIASGDIEPMPFPAPPRPTSQGRATLRRIPPAVWNPAICRAIDQAIENRGNVIREDDRSSVRSRARRRVMVWLQRVPREMSEPLMLALRAETGNGDARSIQASAPARTVQSQAAHKAMPSITAAVNGAIAVKNQQEAEVVDDLPEPAPVIH